MVAGHEGIGVLGHEGLEDDGDQTIPLRVHVAKG
jgi:hypothetical protein